VRVGGRTSARLAAAILLSALVATAAAAGAATAPVARARGDAKIVRYDIRIVGHTERTDSAAGETDPDANGTQILTTDWTMTWKSLRFSVRDLGTSIVVVPVRRARTRGPVCWR
jgi:hypothetical protein